MTRSKQTVAKFGAWTDKFCRVRALLALGICALMTVALFIHVHADDKTEQPVRFDLRLERLVGELSSSFVMVQVATSVTNTRLGLRQTPILMQTIPAIVIDTGGFLLCAASLLVDEDSMSLTHQGIKYSVKRVGIDYRSGLALLKTSATSLPPVTLSGKPSTSGSVSLFLRATSGNGIEPRIAFSSGTSAVDGYVEFGGPIGSGAVGGAFFDMSGNLIGVALGALDDAMSSNRVFAVPAARIEPILSRLRCCGDRHAGYLGLQVIDTELHGVNPSLLGSVIQPGRESKDRLGDQQAETNQGLQYASIANTSSSNSSSARIIEAALVTYIEPGSPAEFSGLSLGDVIFRVDDNKVANAAILRDFVRGCRPDSVIHLAVLRGDSRVNLSARIGAAPTLKPIQRGAFPKALSEGSGGTNREVDGLKRLIRSLEERVKSLEKRLSESKK